MALQDNLYTTTLPDLPLVYKHGNVKKAYLDLGPTLIPWQTKRERLFDRYWVAYSCWSQELLKSKPLPALKQIWTTPGIFRSPQRAVSLLRYPIRQFVHEWLGRVEANLDISRLEQPPSASTHYRQILGRGRTF